MHLVIFTHPVFKVSQSMPKYANMIKDGMKAHAHSVELWTAKSYFSQVPANGLIKKWLGYLDQFLIFPFIIKWKLLKCPDDTLFVFTDHALGPWVPYISGRPHVVHCHDFMAQRSALGELPENKVKLTGKIYQKLIRSGYRKAENFISISNKTKTDLHRFLKHPPRFSEVIYNGLNQKFNPCNPMKARKLIESQFNVQVEQGYILHVGGNQFYKNRGGVIKIYNAWRAISDKNIPLLMVGAPPNKELMEIYDQSPFKDDIFFLMNISDENLRAAYQGATVLLFPSLEEGFGWPIAEAMASGCPVVTTNASPMKEIGADCSFYIPRRYEKQVEDDAWAEESAKVVDKIIRLKNHERVALIEKGLKNVERFETEKSLEQIEKAYINVYKSYHQ